MSSTAHSHPSPSGQKGCNLLEIWNTPCTSDQRPGNSTHVYQRISPRRVINQFGIDQTNYSAYLLSSTVYPTGVKVSFLSDGRGQKCGFDVVAKYKTQNVSVMDSGKSLPLDSNISTPKMSVVEFLETCGESPVRSSSKTKEVCGAVRFQGYGRNKAVETNGCIVKRRENRGFPLEAPDIFKKKVLQGRFYGNIRGTTVWDEPSCDILSPIDRQSSSVEGAILPGRHRYRTHELSSESATSKTVSRKTVKSGDNHRKPSFTRGRTSFTGTEVLSGVAIFNGHRKEIVPLTYKKDISTSWRGSRLSSHGIIGDRLPLHGIIGDRLFTHRMMSGNLSTHRMINSVLPTHQKDSSRLSTHQMIPGVVRTHPSIFNINSAIKSSEILSLEIAANLLAIHGKHHTKETPKSLSHSPRGSERYGIKNIEKLPKHGSKESRPLKMESGKYRPYSKINTRGHFVASQESKHEVKPEMSVQPYLNYVSKMNNYSKSGGAATSTRCGGCNCGCKIRLTLNSPVTDNGGSGGDSDNDTGDDDDDDGGGGSRSSYDGDDVTKANTRNPPTKFENSPTISTSVT